MIVTDISEVECDNRIVKPLSSQVTRLEVIALSNGEALTEYGEYLSEEQITIRLNDIPPTVFVTRNGSDLVARFDKHWTDDPLWNWKATPKERELIREGHPKRASRCTVSVSWFGFKAFKPGGKEKQKGIRHIVLDPVTFYGRKLDEIWPGPETVLERLLAWGTQLRNWTYENRLHLRPTNGSVSSQLLRDKRFYPNSRRKIAKGVNERARDNLPGNYYRLYVDDDHKERSAIYLDQTRAHHYHAQRIQLPHADCLFARGQFHPIGRHPSFSVNSNYHGLYYLRYRTPNRPSRLVFTWYDNGQKPDTEYNGFVYSNEIELLKDLGYTIIGAIAFWGGRKLDTGIRAIAKWSNEQLDDHGGAAWLKPILLSAYGVLATRPKPVLALYGRAKRGTSASVDTGGNTLTGMLVGKTTGPKVEPAFANVLHRGMIEAATRAESLGYAHYLTGKGYTVLSIYADAVIIADDEGKDLPLQINPWRIKQKLTHLQFINTQAFVSGEMTKLPGIINRDILKVSRGVVGKSPTLPKLEQLSGRIIVNGGYIRQ